MQVTYMDDVIGAEQSTRAHQAQASGESRAATIERLLKGAIDLHCHRGPSVMPRDHDHSQAITAASDAGLRAILFKVHFYYADPLADLFRRHFSALNLHMFYGVVPTNAKIG